MQHTFSSSAKVLVSGFGLDQQDVALVVQICRQLDGIPLAIELAVAPLRALSLQQVAARLNACIELLTGGSRTALPHHRTLHALIGWSYDLLSDTERRIFTYLAVFAGGWILETAEAIIGRRLAANADGAIHVENTAAIMHVLLQLVDKSLVVVEPGDPPRYRYLEPIREYADERLSAGGEADILHQLHASYFVAFIEDAEPKLTGSEQGWWLDRLEMEHDNLRAALQWAVEHGNGIMALRIAGVLWRFWFGHGYLSEGRRWLDEILALPGANYTIGIPGSEAAQVILLSTSRYEPFDSSLIALRAKALNGAGVLAHWQDDYERATSLFTESLLLYRHRHDQTGIATALYGLGLVHQTKANYRVAQAIFEESLDLFRSINNQWGTAYVSALLGQLALTQGKYIEATPLLEEALILFKALKEWQAIAKTLNGLGFIALCRGDATKAQPLLEESLALAQQLGDTVFTGRVLIHLAETASMQHDYIVSQARYRESILLLHKAGERWYLALCLEGLAGVLAIEGYPDQACLLCGAATALRQILAAPRPPVYQETFEQTLERIHAQISGEAFEVAWSHGQMLPLSQIIAYAMMDEGYDIAPHG